MRTLLVAGIALTALFTACDSPVTPDESRSLELKKGSRIVLVGNGLGSRMLHTGLFETRLHLRYPDLELFIRNMCDEGNTPAFRPHSGRQEQLAFPGAESFLAPYTGGNTAAGDGHFESEDQWLTRLRPDVIIAFFGFNESFQGSQGIANFRAELTGWVRHTLAQKYDGVAAPRLALVSPTAYQDLTATMDVPSGAEENGNLAAYTSVMEAVATEQDVLFVNAFSASLSWYGNTQEALTADGALLNDAGYDRFSAWLIDRVFGAAAPRAVTHRDVVHAAVTDKNWFWINDFKIPNGVHVFGRRHKPYGPDNYPFEIDKIRAMTAIRDRAIWAATRGEKIDVASLDAATGSLPPVETNYSPSNKNGKLEFLTGEAALATISVPEGYAIQQWATEVEFPDLDNPVQMSFDNKGRLWVAVMPSYPHYRPGDSKPNDKLLILEDTDGDGKADKQTVFADQLHLPMGFEFAPEGVYLSQGINLVLLKDLDGDDRADAKEVILSGFDDHDTHHAISAYCADPSGAFFMCEGVFLRTNVETAYGPVRATDGGFYRYSPQRKRLERHAQLSIPNPWGIAFDDWGQHFFLYTSSTNVEWMLPGSVRSRYGVKNPRSHQLIEAQHRVRPTSGIEFMSSRHFPDEVQGDLLLNNTIGFLGTKQHSMAEEGTGYETKWRQDLTTSSDGNFRPVDLEIAPDGSLYIVDWHNPLIGHMQHNARDPNRDHSHGRIYRITYPSRPLVKPAKVATATIDELLENLKLHEYRTRYRTRRELRGRDPSDVLAALEKWIAGLDESSAKYEHHLLEALWVKWGLNRVDGALLRRLLQSSDHRARAAAVRVLRYSGHRIEDQADLLAAAAADAHGRVRLEAIVAASWLDRENGLAVLAVAEQAAERERPVVEMDDRVDVAEDGVTIVVAPGLAGQLVNQIILEVPGPDKTINLSEVEILSGGENVAANAKWSLSSEYGDGQYPASNLVDGDKSNFAHTAEGQSTPRVVAEFETAVAVEKVTIFNRQGYEARFDGAVVIFKFDDVQLVSCQVRIGDAISQMFDRWVAGAYRAASAKLNNQVLADETKVAAPGHLRGAVAKTYVRGAEIYARDGHCATCHQKDGEGLVASQFPPISGTKWVNQSKERLIKLTLHGMYGPIEVKGKSYPGVVPMTPFKGLLTDEDVAAVLTYVRNSFGNKASPVTADEVTRVRTATKGHSMFYKPADLLQEHPHR
ncbi:MAG: PVC-type heme-binding CxxCH protein [Planctomycetota bacterium]